MSSIASANRTATVRRHGRRVARLLRALAIQAPLAAAYSLDDLPWVQSLDEGHLRCFLDEYASTYQAALESDDWQSLDDFLGEWAATADALSDPELRGLLRQDTLPAADRVRLDYPA